MSVLLSVANLRMEQISDCLLDYFLLLIADKDDNAAHTAAAASS